MINQGRYYARQEQDFVLFVLGLRVNHYWNFREVLKLYRLIPKVFAEARQLGGIGYLGGTYRFTLREPLIIQYWQSMDALQRFAHDPAHSHAQIWKLYHATAGKSGSIGIWHEAYHIVPKGQQSNYFNMPFTGMGQFSPIEPIGKGTSTIQTA